MHQMLLSRYFREELKQRIWGNGSVLGRSHRVLLGCIPTSNLRQPKMSPDIDRSPLDDTPFPSVRTTGLGKAPEKEHKHPTQPRSTSARKKYNGLNFYIQYFSIA